YGEPPHVRPFIWSQATGMQELFTDHDGYAYDINNSGQIVGNFVYLPETTGYVWQNGSYSILPSHMNPFRINNLGDMVGGSDLGVTLSRSGNLYDINALIAATGWR